MELLPSKAQHQRLLARLREDYIDKSLFKKPLGFIDHRPRTAVPSGFDVARELDEDANSTRYMNIGIRGKAL